MIRLKKLMTREAHNKADPQGILGDMLKFGI